MSMNSSMPKGGGDGTGCPGTLCCCDVPSEGQAAACKRGCWERQVCAWSQLKPCCGPVSQKLWRVASSGSTAPTWRRLLNQSMRARCRRMGALEQLCGHGTKVRGSGKAVQRKYWGRVEWLMGRRGPCTQRREERVPQGSCSCQPRARILVEQANHQPCQVLVNPACTIRINQSIPRGQF